MANGLVASDILEQNRPERFEGVVYRVMINDYPPDKENTVGARWNPKGLAAIYTSCDADLAFAEVRYNLQRQPRPVRPDLMLVLYRISVNMENVVDLDRSIGALAKIGLTSDRLLADSWVDSQAIGNTVAWLGRGGLLVPSVRGAHKNLVIYPSTAGAYRYEAEEVKRVRVGDKLS